MNPILEAKKFLDSIMYKEQQPLFENYEKIESVRSMWADEESRIAYDRELAFKMLEPHLGVINAQKISKSGIDPETYEKLCVKALQDSTMPSVSPRADRAPLSRCLTGSFYLQEYQYKDIVRIHQNDVVLDGGACFGDTAIWFLKKGAREIWSFEIDRNNLVCIAETLQLNNVTETVHMIPKALGKTEGKIWYNSAGSPGGGFVSEKQNNNEPGYTVSVTALDAFCTENNVHPDFIKMDIEGAEVDALIGAKHYIRDNHPDLTICLYHQLSHMWEIPILIKNLCPDYKFYCKKIHYITECVLYATCRS